jgi:hypothetical protein
VVQYAFDVLVLMSEMFVSLRVRSGARRYRPSLRLPAAPYVPWEVVRVWALSNFCAEDGSLVLEMSSGGHGRDTQTQRGAEGMAEETSQEGLERLSRSADAWRQREPREGGGPEEGGGAPGCLGGPDVLRQDAGGHKVALGGGVGQGRGGRERRDSLGGASGARRAERERMLAVLEEQRQQKVRQCWLEEEAQELRRSAHVSSEAVGALSGGEAGGGGGGGGEDQHRQWYKLHELGRGGFAAVYRGFLWKAGGGVEFIAIKESLQRSEEAVQKMQHEARVMALLTAHTNLVRYFGHSAACARPYILMEYCPDGTLRDFSDSCAEAHALPYKVRLDREAPLVWVPSCPTGWEPCCRLVAGVGSCNRRNRRDSLVRPRPHR